MKSVVVSVVLFLGVTYHSSAQFIFDGYTDKLSYRAGETVTFFINGANPFNLFYYRLIAFDGTISLTIPGFNDVHPQDKQFPEP